MKIVCALSPKQVENLYKDIYKNMLNSLEADKAFNANDYMKTLFTQIAEKKDVPTAMKFLQQVPSIMRAVGVKSQFDNLDISLDALKPLVTDFKNEKDGFKNVLNYFKPEMSDKDKLELLVANQFISSLPTEIEDPKEIKDPFRFKPFSWLSTTFQQLIQLNPLNKLKLLSEKPDANKNRIYNTIDKIQAAISAEQALVTDGTLTVAGKVLKLKPVRLLDLYDTNQADIDNTTAQDVIRTKSIKNRPAGVETQDTIALVLSDEDGNYYHFTEDGNFSTEEEGGKIVYQFMRNVNKDNTTGEYVAVNQYGYDDQIQTPEMIAEKLEITVEKAKELQQEELKNLYEIKQAVVNNQQNPLLNVVELSAGVPESLAQKKISLKNLRSLPFVNNATFKTITPVIEKGSDVSAVITLNGTIYPVDKPDLSEVLIQKITSVLTNPKLSNKQKYDFVNQFLSDKASMKARRHTLLYNPGTDALTFQYTEKTNADGTGGTYTLLNDQLNNKYDLVYDVLRYAKGDSRKGKPFPAKMTYNIDVLSRNGYQDYNIETGEISDEYTPYIPLLETLDAADIKISESTDPGFYNTYIRFSIPSDISIDATEEPKVRSQYVGKFIYSTPGSGKTTLANTDENIIDTDELIVEEMNKRHPDFKQEANEPIQEFILRYVIKYDHKAEINKIVLNQVKELTASGKTVLTGTMAFIKDVDVVFRMNPTSSRAIERFGSVEKAKDFAKKEKDEANKAKKKSIETKGIEQSIMTSFVSEPVTQTPKEERDNIIEPENTPKPEEGGLGSLLDDEMYRSGKNLDLENITSEDIKNAETWWNNSPLSKFIDFKTMVNIVNSDVYAKFIAYGAVLNNKYGEIQIGQRTSIVDVYHEAWHGFTQLFLTPTERKALYDEVAKQEGSFTLLNETTVKFSDATYGQLEEYLAEEFRTYAKEQGVKANSPKRNSIFRKILNFLKNLFKSKNTKDKLFNELYLAGKNKKNSQKFLNKYSPLVNTFSFKELNRGIENVVEPTIDALDKQDSNLVSKSIDSFFSLRADKNSEETGTKEATIRIFTNEKTKEKVYAEAKVDFQNKLDTAKEELEKIQDDPTKALEIEKLQNKIRIFETALKNWGDKKSGVIAYHNENSDYKIINKKFKEIKDEEEDDTTTQSQTANSKTVENSSQGETLGIKDDTQTKSLLDLASSETIVLLSSLHKIENGKTVLNELGYPELADFATTWNNTIRALNGEKNPSKMLENIRTSAQTIYPEFKQLLRKLPGYTIENGKIVINEKNRFEVKTLSAFWQDFQKTRVTYLQTTIFDNNIAEVTKASIETMSLMRKFQAKFKSDLENKFIGRSAENVAFLKVAEVVAEFGKDGKLDSDRAYEFARAIGLYLDDLSIIKNELNLNQKAKQMYGLIYIYRAMYDIDNAMKNPKTTQKTVTEINEFLLDPIGKLTSGFSAGTIAEKEVRQKNAIDRILGLQAKYGFDSANFAVLNAEKNLVFEHIDDHTISYITYALNKMDNLSEAWTPGSEFEYMSYLNPLINSFTTRLGIINTLFDKNDTEDGVYNWAKRSGKSLQLFINSGTQVEAIDDGTNTTSLDARGKFLQELHSMLKGGMIEFMRHASKSSSFGARIDGEGGILGGVGKGTDTRLWVDIDKFAVGNAYEYVVKNHMIPYIAGELERINKFKANKELFKTYKGYNRVLADGTMAGENFTAFDNVLTKDTKAKILEAVTDPNIRFEDYIKTNPKLYKEILEEITKYFTDQTKDLQNYYNEAKYLSPDLLDKLSVFNLDQEKVEEVLMSAYAVNSWVQNFETATLFYGDIVQYNHEKEEMHKRNSGATSGGLKIRTDQSIRRYLTELNGKLSYAQAEGLETLAYTGTYNSAIIQDIKRESVYSPIIERELRKDYTERLKGKVPADKLSEEVEMRVAQDLKPYAKMEEADGQGWITIDAYRNLKMASDQWSDLQEELFKKIINKQPVKYSDIIEFFPVYKVQNFGHLANTALPVMAMHKFALAPLIPPMIKNSDLESLHKQMIKNNIQYVTFPTGSKVGSVTSQVNEKGEAVADKIYDDKDQKSLKTNIKFTPNKVYLEYLKDVTKVPVSYKNKTVFATQLRKLILSNLYRNGELTVKNQVLIKDYEDAVDAYGEFLKMELLNEIGYTFEDGKYIGNFKNFLELVQRELGRKNIPEHHIEFVNMNPDNSLKTDLSFHLRADEIEKIIVSLIEKRLVRQKIKGEALVQVSSAMTNGIWDNQIQFDKADIEQVRKFMGTNNLPFYNYNKDRTSAMKVAIALQGDFVNLLNLDYKGEKIGTRERLNQAIKDDEWLNANDGANRKAITMIAVRIPVQGLNSMEYMEVYEFLDEAAGPIIIPPSEIVAKSGADFDVDKLTTFMPSLDKSGKFVESAISNERLQNLLNQNKDTEEGKQMNARLLSTQKAALENKLITSISNILSLPENYASLVRPNATYLLKDAIADKIADKVTDYNRFDNYHGEETRLNEKGEKAISPTRVLEPLYNLHKHEANMIGKKVLGIVAIYNALHPVLNSLGASMPKTYRYKKSKERKSRIFLPVNKTKDGRISLSETTTVDGDLISELYSQLMNGSVDVEKDAWIFFIQGNEELIGLMAMLLKSGVPREHAIKFLSQPLVREYAKEQRLLKSSYSDLITDNSGIPKTQLTVNYYGEPIEIKIPDKEIAAARVLSRFGVDKPMRFVKGNADQASLDAFIKKGNILNKEGVFDLKLLDAILEDPNNPARKDQQIATLLHVMELEKQFSGYQELMRLSNPDTSISKTLQQVLNRNVLLDEIENDSRVESKIVNALRKESILSTFFDNQIVQDLVEPVFPLRNSKDISNIIIGLIKNNSFQITKRFGDTEKFISEIKNNMVNSVFQNYMMGYVQSEKDLLNIPSDLLAKYFTKDVFFQNTGYSFAEDIFDIINQHPELKDKYSLLSQLSIPEVKDGQKILTLNNSRLLSKGNIAEQYYQNIVALADPNVSKVDDPVQNKYISDMFRVLPLMAIYQNGVGYSRFGFNEILPFEDYVTIMNNAAVDFNNQSFENKQLYMDRVFSISMNPKNRIFKNFVSAAFASTIPTFEKKNRFTVIPQSGVKDAKAVVKSSISTQFIGFGEGIVGKDGKRSSTQIYREQVGNLANTGKYSSTDVIFVSVPGLRGDAAITKREQDKTIKEAIKAIEAEATILVDNKAYTFDSKNTYNTGEKRLFQNLEAKGYNYSEITIDGVKIGTWSKSRTTQAPISTGVEISSNAKGLAAALTNPTELAKSKGNLTQSYPIEFNGKTYKDVEAAYQALKDKSESITKPTKENSKNYKLMVDLIKAKLQQHSRLVSEITKQGGSTWVLSSTHQPTNANTVWETGGKNWFIEALNDAYLSTQPTTAPTVITEIKPEDITFKSNRLETFERQGDLESVKGYGLIIKGQPNVDLFTFKDDSEWVIIDNKSKLLIPIRGGISTKRDIAKLLSNDLTFHISKERNRKLLEGIGFNFTQEQKPGDQLDLFNQRTINPNQKFDKVLAKKIQDKLEKLYPEIKLNISNTPVWEQGDNVLNQEQYNNQVNYRIKTVDILLTPKADQVFAKGIKNKWTLDKILTELQIPKNQKGLIERVIETMPYFEGIPFNAQLAYAIASTYNYTIEINTSKDKIEDAFGNVWVDKYPNKKIGDYITIDNKQWKITGTRFEDDSWGDSGLEQRESFIVGSEGENTQYYSNLTVPGGTNYTEQEVTTPGVVPNIKGHAQFATDKGIGWFRSDERTNSLKQFNEFEIGDTWYAQGSINMYGREYYGKIVGNNEGVEISKEEFEKAKQEFISSNPSYTDNTKTRRILEVQSDLFQKGRDKYFLYEKEGKQTVLGTQIIDSSENQFLQLLNKDNNWVTFFVKSIIQDSAKKGYEKVLFPSGNTASKVEGHTTLEEFKKQKEDRIKELEKDENIYHLALILDKSDSGILDSFPTKEEALIAINRNNKEIQELDSSSELTYELREKNLNLNEINQLKQELERIEGPEGFGALKPIYNFYENVVANVLKKQGYTPTQVTDEYGNTWNEVIINQARDLQNVLLQKNEADKIIGQANIKAMTVLIDAVNQRQDTLPHEYAHHYIAWFRNTPIVQEGIKRFGSEEALVQAIGEQVVKQKGNAYNWWKKFTNFILNLLSNKQVLQVLTDSFLNRTNLNEVTYNEEMESQEIETETTQERQEKIDTLNELEFKNWFTNEATKNPDLDILDALDYYMKCKR